MYPLGNAFITIAILVSASGSGELLLQPNNMWRFNKSNKRKPYSVNSSSITTIHSTAECNTKGMSLLVHFTQLMSLKVRYDSVSFLLAGRGD